ncbi:aldehyde dehydrogenase family protein [Streptomyces sp. NPDC088794]|uniref:aldehyde dehydrogenase family protein n=1 Tax=Streptomyces sp. NPDC088794 TaxID=3365902 RepID=UPI0038047CB1
MELPRPSARGATIVRRDPVGVVAAITSWNFPLGLALSKLAPLPRRAGRSVPNAGA